MISNILKNYIFLQDFKYGGTPLHWAKTSEILEALLEAGCLINARNFQVLCVEDYRFCIKLLPQLQSDLSCSK